MRIKSPKSSGLSKNAVAVLLKDPLWQYNSQLSQKMIPHSVYTHPTRGVLNVFSDDGRGRLYKSHSDFEQHLQINDMIRQQPRAYHILDGLLPHGEAFLTHVEALIEHFRQTLKLSPELLDKSIASLEHVDKAIRKYGKRKTLESPAFAGLIAYVGEVVRTATSGRWEMRLSDQDGKTWESWIVGANERYFIFWSAVYDELAEPGPFSIYGAIGGHLKMGGRTLEQLKPKPVPRGGLAFYQRKEE